MNRNLRATLYSCLAIWAITLLDVMTTYAGILGLGAVELNPLQHALGWPIFWATKGLLALLISAWLLFGAWWAPQWGSYFRNMAAFGAIVGAVAPLVNAAKIALAVWK